MQLNRFAADSPVSRYCLGIIYRIIAVFSVAGRSGQACHPAAWGHKKPRRGAGNKTPQLYGGTSAYGYLPDDLNPPVAIGLPGKLLGRFCRRTPHDFDLLRVCCQEPHGLQQCPIISG